MGWLFSYSIRTRKDLIESLRRPERFGQGIELLHSTAVGNNHWFLAKTLETGKIWIGLDMMAGGGRTGEGWGHKGMSETAGPYVYNCPLHFLEKASPAEGYAVGWREKVREYHAQRAARPVPKEGAVVEYGGHDYRLIRPVAPRRGWHVIRTLDGLLFRMGASQLSKASFKEVIPA